MSSQPQDDGDTSSVNPPPNANEGCVGPTASTAGKASACAGCPNQSACSTGAFSSAEALAAKAREDETLRSALSGVTHVVLVLSGKGGVGKSTVACQIAHTLSWRGYSVGVLDVDLCGPSAPRMLGVNGREVHKSGSGWTPVYANENLAVMSISFLLPNGDSAVVWRGPRKNGLIKQFLTETDWSGGGGGEDGGGGIDYLIVDTPPGTSDEHISTVQFLQAAMPEGAGVGAVGGAIVVTTPEEVSMADVRKELNFCHKTKVRVLGVVENMASFSKKLSEMKFIRRGVTTTEMDVESSASAINGTAKKDEVTALAEETDCTEEIHSLLRRHCPEVLDLYVGADIFPPSNDGPAGMAARYGVPLMGSLPLDPNLLKACEDGVCFTETYRGGDGGSGSPAVGPLDDLVDRLVKALPVEDAV